MALEGFTVNDSIYFDIGITQSGTYVTFCDSTIRIIPSASESMKWDVTAKACFFIDKTHCDNNGSWVKQEDVIIRDVDRSTLNSTDIFTLLLNDYKTNFTSTTDVTM